MQRLTDRITADPKICDGDATVRGLPITVTTILDSVRAGQSHREIIEDYPSLEDGDINACLRFAGML